MEAENLRDILKCFDVGGRYKFDDLAVLTSDFISSEELRVGLKILKDRKFVMRFVARSGENHTPLRMDEGGFKSYSLPISYMITVLGSEYVSEES